MKPIGWKVIKIVLGLFMIYAGAKHFINPTFFTPFIPDFLPFALAIIYISGIIEVLIGLLLLTNKYARIGGWAFFALMIAFLPLHVWDVITTNPVIGSTLAAWIRLPIQFLLFFLGYKIATLWSHQNKLNHA